MGRAIIDRPVFVPLTKEAFLWFESGKKTHELRRERGQFRRARLTSGREVVLRLGYSGRQLVGTIGVVATGMTLASVLLAVGPECVIPPAESLNEAVEIAARFVGTEGPFIAFEVRVSRP